jgi:hypothetical protein
MEQMKITPDALIDYSQFSIPKAVKALKPVLFQEGEGFCCLLGPDPQAGIFGCGETPEAAIADWNRHLSDRMSQPLGDDPVAQYVEEVLNASNLKPW